MARMKRVDVPDDYKPDAKPGIADGIPLLGVTHGTTTAPPVPDGYAARTIVWPQAYWRVFDLQSARAGIPTSKWLEKLLAHMARE